MSQDELYDCIIVGGGPGDLRQKYANQIVIAAADGCTAALATAHFVEMKKASAVCFATAAEVLCRIGIKQEW